jgi:hypothetical protein
VVSTTIIISSEITGVDCDELYDNTSKQPGVLYKQAASKYKMIGDDI